LARTQAQRPERVLARVQRVAALALLFHYLRLVHPELLVAGVY
jgi:hypothetical protein